MERDLRELGRLADENMAGAWASFGRSSGAALGVSAGCTFVATGLPVAFFNGAFPAGPVDDPDRVVSDATAFMADAGVPWLLWVREGIDDALLDAGRRAGLAVAGGPPALALPSIGDIPPVPDDLDVAVVDDTAGVAVLRDLMARGFEMPVEIASVLITDGMLDDADLVMLVGSVDGTPVSCSTVAITGTTAGIYNVATPLEHRRRGYGEALTWAAIAEGVRHGCDHAVLQASELGAPVYRRMGFVDVGNYVQLEGPPPTS